jgi:hydrogenase maturation protease
VGTASGDGSVSDGSVSGPAVGGEVAPTPGKPRVVVFACGDPLRADDAVGPLVARSLPAHIRALADIHIVGALEPEDLTRLPAHVRVVVIDGVTGPPAGALVEIELFDLGSRSRRVSTTSSHQLPLDGVLALAQVLRDEPLEGSFIGVGLGSVAIGEDLGPEVRAALPRVRDAVVCTVQALSGGHEGRPSP